MFTQLLATCGHALGTPGHVPLFPSLIALARNSTKCLASRGTNMGAAEMTERIAEVSPRLKARLAGLCYVLMLPTGGVAMFVRGRFIVKGDAAATAANILAHETWFRLAFAGDLLVVPIYIVFTVLLYDLMKPVSRSISLLAAFFSLMGCATQAFACLFELAPLVVLGRDHYLTV